MKKLLLLMLVVGFGTSLFAQHRIVPPKEKRDVAVKMTKKIKDVDNFNTASFPALKDASLVEENVIGTTFYDLQSNASTQNRIYQFDDGTIGAVWTMGFSFPNFTNDRGTGYNYFDGNAWGPAPTVRIEAERTGWPSYSAWGENGEIIANHTQADGIWVGYREQKGTGTWEYNILGGPPGVVDLTWPRIMTSGVNREIVHCLSCTWPDSGPYMGQSPALLYSRSIDGGQSWNIENHFFEELGPNYYTAMSGDTYEFAESKDGILAFLIGDSWMDLALMKSTDDGDSWTKTVIWECPYPLYVSGVTDTFYCADGSHHLAIDNNGIIHVVFGINRAYADDAGSYWFPLVDGIGYWNENRPTFSNSMDALNPYGDPGTELQEDYSLIGWSQDINNNGEWDIIGEPGTYYLGASSMPQIIVDDNNEIYFIYSTLQETYNNGIQDLRHLWARYSPNGEFWGPFFYLTNDIIHIFDECVFPSISPTSDDNFYLVYQADIEPGLAVRGDLDPYGENFMYFMKVSKDDVKVGISENDAPISDTRVSQNYPNPFRGTSVVYLTLDRSADISLEVTSITGQVVYSVPAKTYPAGKSELNIHAAGLRSGIYFYTVRSGETAVTKKMMVE